MSRGLRREDLEDLGLSREGFEAASEVYERKELMEMTHEFIKEYVLRVDKKASYLLTGLFGLLGLGANALNIQRVALSGPVLIPISLAATMGTLGIIFSGWVVYPRVYPPHDPGFIYWERVRQFGSRANFIAAVDGMADDQPLQELAKNVYNTADIASRKYGWLRWSMAATAAMFYFAAVAGLRYAAGDWLLAVAFPSAVAAALYFGLLAEHQRTVARSTAAFRTTADGELRLGFEAGFADDLDVELAESTDGAVVRVSGIDPDRRSVRVVNADAAAPRPWLVRGLGVLGYVVAVLGTGYLTGNWPLAVSGPTLVAGALAPGYRSGDKREVDRYDASFDVRGQSAVTFRVRALAATPERVAVTETEDGFELGVGGLPSDHIVHVTDPDKTPYDVFQR
jgi:hypothetical protein